MRAARSRYRLLLGLARWAVLWENLWPRLWPASALAAVFLSLALFDVFPLLPALLHAALLALFALGFVATLLLGFGRVSIPAHKIARARVERDSGLSHHPLAAIEDNLAAGEGNSVSERLWALHRTRAKDAAERLRVAAPRAGLARIDPWGFRAVVLLALVVALVAARSDPAERLARAFLPNFSGTARIPVSVEVWLTPPAYTRVAPVFLEPTANSMEPPMEPRPVPAGTALLAQVTGPRLMPVLNVGDQAVPFEPVGSKQERQSFRLETTLESGDRLAVTAGEDVLAEWPIRVVPDAPPTITLTAPPESTDQAYLRLGVEAADDYGLAEVKTVIARADVAEDRPEEPMELSLPLPARAAKTLKARPARDLSAHLWAGHPAKLTLFATDIAGQSAQTEPVDFVLPERHFLHPVARAIVALRKKLIDPSDAVRAEVQVGLSLVGIAPHRYGHDTVVMLGLSMAGARLRHDDSAEAVPTVADLLWELALRLEDGGLSIAERDLRRVEERLMEALRDGADSAEVEDLLRKLEDTLRQFLSELAEEMQRMGMTEAPIDPNAEFMDGNDLQRMIDEIREMARTGNMDAARQRLAELQRMLQDLRTAMRPGNNPQQSQQAAEARQLMNALQELTKRQQELLDQAFQRMREGRQQQGRQQGRQPGQQGQLGQQGQPSQQGQQGQGQGQGQGQQGQGQGRQMSEAEIQEALRRALGELMLGFDSLMGQIPGALGQAERAMRRAADALRGQDTEAAIEAETEALENLRSGGQQATQQMSRQLGMMPGFLRGDRPVMPLGQRRDRDPFGRRSEKGSSGFSSDQSTNVPDEMQLRQAHEILRELRRRAGQRERPRPELDFIERLLKRF